MKLVHSGKTRCRFQLSERDKKLLFQVLKLYPLIPPGHHKLSRAGNQPENQTLLDDAIAEQRKQNRQIVAEFLESESRFRDLKDGSITLSLTHAEIEWLLQVLNDIRVGSWIALGSPDGGIVELAEHLTDNNIQFFWSMEMSGHFQMALVKPLSDDSPEAAQPPTS